MCPKRPLSILLPELFTMVEIGVRFLVTGKRIEFDSWLQFQWSATVATFVGLSHRKLMSIQQLFAGLGPMLVRANALLESTVPFVQKTVVPSESFWDRNTLPHIFLLCSRAGTAPAVRPACAPPLCAPLVRPTCAPRCCAPRCAPSNRRRAPHEVKNIVVGASASTLTEESTRTPVLDDRSMLILAIDSPRFSPSRTCTY